MGEVYSADDVIKALNKIGFYFHHQRGSHITLKRDIPKKRITVPNHKTIAKGTFKNILKQAGLNPENFKKTTKIKGPIPVLFCLEKTRRDMD